MPGREYPGSAVTPPAAGHRACALTTGGIPAEVPLPGGMAGPDIVEFPPGLPDGHPRGLDRRRE